MTTTVYVLKAFGEAKEKLDPEDFDQAGVQMLDEPDARWTLEWAFRAPNAETADRVAEDIMAEAEWSYGTPHGWEVREVGL